MIKIKIQFCIPILCCLVLCCLAIFSGVAGASSLRLFSAGFMGLNIPDKSPSIPAFAGSLGFRLTPQWRLAGEVSVGEQNLRLTLVNLYYDLDVGSARFQPFLTIGAGLTDPTSPEMVWQAGGGMNYRLNDHLSLSGGYRHIDIVDTNHDGYDHGRGSHELRLGMTYKLPATPILLNKARRD